MHSQAANYNQTLLQSHTLFDNKQTQVITQWQ